MGSIVMNMAANMLGLDNAATPLGLKAMNELQELNPEPEVATSDGPQSLRPEDFAGLIEQMRAGQAIFDETGGCHAAAIFDGAARVLAVAEDLGRHNALDKAIGTVLLERGSLAGCGVVLSSRLSLEMVLKAVRSGLEIMAAVSAPTSLAIEVADRFGITLCGFVRETRATVYTHRQRIL